MEESIWGSGGKARLLSLAFSLRMPASPGNAEVTGGWANSPSANTLLPSCPSWTRLLSVPVYAEVLVLAILTSTNSELICVLVPSLTSYVTLGKLHNLKKDIMIAS